MSTLRYSPGEYLAGSAIREMLEAVSDELVRRGWPAITVVSGTRLYEWQEAIFRARYVLASQVNGRKVYDFQWWNGVLWARISSAGRVAPPSPTAPHVANIAADLGAPYNSYGAARNAMLQVIRDLGLDGQVVNNGTSFDEVWHWESRRGAGQIGRPAGAQEEDDMNAEQDNRLKNIENMLTGGPGYGRPQVIQQRTDEIRDRMLVKDPQTGQVLWDYFQQTNNQIISLTEMVAKLAGGQSVDVRALFAEQEQRLVASFSQQIDVMRVKLESEIISTLSQVEGITQEQISQGVELAFSRAFTAVEAS